MDADKRMPASDLRDWTAILPGARSVAWTTIRASTTNPTPTTIRAWTHGLTEQLQAK